MIPSALPVVTDAAEPVPPARSPKGAPFAAVIDAVPADAAPDAKATPADKSDATAEPTMPDGTPPAAPAIVADATALIAQLCPPPVAANSADTSQACHSRESENPAPTVELDSRVRGNDIVVEGKALPHAAKLVRQDGKSATFGLEALSDAAPKTGEPVALPASQPARLADAVAATDALAPTPLADVAVTHHLDLAHDSQWLDQLAHDIARSADQNANLRFSLSPEHLGRMTVDLAANADGTSVRLTTESEAAHRIVSDAQPRLVAEARAQGLRISETQVDLDQRPGGQQPQRSPDGQTGQDRKSPAVLWTESPQRARAAATSVPAARDLYA